nr:beta-ketoacyl-[acyl-carrier-protein] synthase II [Desulfobacterales bacterium]
MKRRVVVTGIGLITSLGTGVENCWKALCEGRSGIDKIQGFDASDLPVNIAGEVNDFEPEKFLERKEIRRMDRFVQFAIAATKMAIEDSGVKIDETNEDRAGVIIGTGFGGLHTLESNYSNLLRSGPKKVSPLFLPMMIANMASGQVAIHFGAKGPNNCMITACAAGAHSIGEAARLIQYGVADIMIAGSSEATISPLVISGFYNMKAMTRGLREPKEACRPFDKLRDGLVPAEGVGIMILEELSQARRRRAEIYAELIGYGLNGDGYHITMPDPEGEGARKCMQMALDDAGISYQEVDYINAHGTSTPLNDVTETKAIKSVFKEHAYEIPISSTKSMTGHALGAAGAIEAVVSVLTVSRGIIPPTINYEVPDPECDLDYVPNVAREKEICVAMSNSFGFGGTNGCLIFKKV